MLPLLTPFVYANCIGSTSSSSGKSTPPSSLTYSYTGPTSPSKLCTMKLSSSPRSSGVIIILIGGIMGSPIFLTDNDYVGMIGTSLY